MRFSPGSIIAPIGVIIRLMRERLQRGEIAKRILLAAAGIAAVAGATVLLAACPGFGYILKEFADWYKKQDKHRRYQIRKTFEQLRRGRLIKLVETGDQTKVVLTEVGKKRVLQYDIEKLEIQLMKKWDGLWRIVIFDIPEFLKKQRWSFRQALKRLGFCRLQKSIWVHPYDCRDEIDFLIEVFGISQFVRLVEAVKFDGEEFIKERFPKLV